MTHESKVIHDCHRIVYALDLSKDNKYLLSGTNDGSFSLFFTTQKALI